jgi:hypothetical protein
VYACMHDRQTRRTATNDVGRKVVGERMRDGTDEGGEEVGCTIAQLRRETSGRTEIDAGGKGEGQVCDERKRTRARRTRGRDEKKTLSGAAGERARGNMR